MSIQEGLMPEFQSRYLKPSEIVSLYLQEVQKQTFPKLEVGFKNLRHTSYYKGFYDLYGPQSQNDQSNPNLAKHALALFRSENNISPPDKALHDGAIEY